MRISLATHAGYCFGVKQALEKTYDALRGGPVYTLGPLIHNEQAVSRLAAMGASILAGPACVPGATVVIRSHGAPPAEIERLEKGGMHLVDATCPNVARIHRKVSQCRREGRQVLIAGEKNHPEIVGTLGWAGEGAVLLSEESDAQELPKIDRACLVAQTTMARDRFEAIVSALRQKIGDLEVFDSICASTSRRGEEAMRLASECDAMVVVGGRQSANTRNLAALCRRVCPNVFSIETAGELQPDRLRGFDHIGIAAGASTPVEIIEEVVNYMNELDKALEAEVTTETTAEQQPAAPQETPDAQPAVEAQEVSAPEPAEKPAPETSIEDAFMSAVEETLVSIRPGQTVRGKVVQVTDEEVCVNIGYKSDGLIPRSELVEEGNPHDNYAVGDDIEVEVVKVNDGEGNVLLSQKNIVARKTWDRLMKSYEEGEYIEAVAKNAVKGGLIAYVDNVRTFIPASHLTERYVEKIDQFVGQTLTLKIIEADQQKRRIVASRKIALQEVAAKAKEEAWERLKVGEIAHGIVRRLTAFGAFVDLGGVDGLIHITDLCWGRIRHPSEIVKVNQEVDVLVLNMDKERDRISLGLKQTKPKPWETAQVNYPVGAIVEGKVAHIVSFGAFIELEPGLDGLVHISQIANHRVEKVEDVLVPGQIVRVRVLDVNPDGKRISLSIRDALDRAGDEQPLADLPDDLESGVELPAELAEELPAEIGEEPAE